MTQLLPDRSPITTPSSRSLADVVAQVRHPRNHATAQLTPHRDELLRLRQAGESIETLAAALRTFDVMIGKETLRRWLARELGQTPKRKARRGRAAAPKAVDNPRSQEGGITPP